jgi:hypothetical protein
MRKILLIVVSIAIAGLLLFFSTHNSNRSFIVKAKQDQLVQSDPEEENLQEEVRERAQQEFQMTYDPELGYVPVERLVTAEQQLRKMRSMTGARVMAGLNWTERGPNNIGGRSRAILIDQSDASGNTVLAGSVGGGIWRTTDFKAGTPAWAPLSGIAPNLAITCIAQDPSSLNTMYAGTGEGFGNFDAIRGLGIYKSIDGGLTWNLLASTTAGGTNVNDFTYVQKVVVYSNGDVYASGISAVFCNSGGVLKSVNGGATWTRVIGLYTGGGVCSNAFDFQGYDIEISTGGDIYASVIDASVADTTRGKIYRSPAGATVGNTGTWTDISPATLAGRFWSRIELACAPNNNNRVYAMFQGTASSIDTILRSDNGGTTWVNVDNTTLWCDQGVSTSVDFSRNQAWYDLILAVKPDDDQTVLAGGVDIMRTVNSGAAWTQLTQWASGCGVLPFVHADIHNIVYFPGSPNELAVVCDGGVFYSANGGASFTVKNTGYNVTQYYSCAIHPTSGSNYMLAGAQDNGSHRFNNAGINTVTTATSGDGGFCFIDQSDATFQVTSFTNSNYRISRNSGTSFTTVANFAGGRFINPADYDNTQNLLYVCGASQNFRRISNVTTGVPAGNSYPVAPNANYAISAVKVDPNLANRVLIAYATAPNAAAVAPLMYVIDNADAVSINAMQITLPAALTAGRYISSIDVENGDPNHYLLTISNYGATQASIWESTDAGANWTSLDNGSSLPDMPVRWGMFVPAGFNIGQRTQSVAGIMIATELGVWSASVITGVTTLWAPNNTGMGNVRVDMLKLRESDKVVVAGTHGRGLYTTALLNGNLPLTFISFAGKTQPAYNDLVWQVENEQNNKGFEIERKYEGEPGFTSLGFVDGLNSTGTNDYSFKDQLVDLGKELAFYRLKQTDFDNNINYSTTISLSRKMSSRLAEYISITGNTLFIRINNGNPGQVLQLRIFDAAGKLLRNVKTVMQTQQIDISSLVSGTYVVELTGPRDQKETQRIIK